MPLQVRVRHPLGERLLELPERGVSQPLIVGREKTSDVQVPVITVAPKHCALFVHEEQWVLQPMTGKVILGGHAMIKPRALRSGDLIALGDGPAAPTLQFDPIGAAEGRSGLLTVGKKAAAVATPSRAPAVRQKAPVPAASARPPAQKPATAPRPAPAPVRPRPAPVVPRAPVVAESEAEGAEPPENDAIDWSFNDPNAAPPKLYVPRRKQMSAVVMVIVVLLGMGALGGVGYYAYKAAHKPPPAPIVIVEKTPEAPQAAAAKPKALFDLDADQAAARKLQAMQKPLTPSSAKPQSGSMHASPATPVVEDPDVVALRTQAQTFDPDWEEIERAHHDVRHMGQSINKYDDYRRNHPGKHTGALDLFTEQAANWLYWQRLHQLWVTRDETLVDIRKKDTDLKNQPTGDFHNQLAAERANLVTQHDQANDLIASEMGFTGEEGPDLENPDQLEKISQFHDPAKYAAFKKRVLKYVRDNHGAVWWVDP